ncbi:Mu transposase C-terminal domain-containing protein [Clostridium bornimense]|uniref:Mu transposase C-terminal domain-containing protein n=1 Tax=Clostridium bornimense TaxID=1216932 RepID=UPI001C11D76E|nr:Mu transposase C-terminal domain-containing protein [Clostridium bornimense]MBU5317732.1 Mu transposase C-terminal domain-containing protein [Clostridium bornimense]
MQGYILENDILRCIKDGSKIRIIWISDNNSNCYAIELNTEVLNIIELSVEELKDSLLSNEYEIDDDVYSEQNIVIDINSLKEKSRERLENAYNIVQYLLENEPHCYRKSYRRKIILEAKEKFNVSERVIYKYFRKYLQGGKLIYSLVDDYRNCGGGGKNKRCGDKKRGRPSYITMATGEKTGINVDDDIRNIFKISIARYFKNRRQRSLTKTYELMLKDFFSIKEEDGTKKVKDVNEIPSLNQFKQWYYKNVDEESVMRARLGDKKFDLNHKDIDSDSVIETLGVGSRFQIDSTPFDVYLVNSLKRTSVIGKPTLYLVADVYSRMIVGMSVIVGSASWDGAALALYNCTQDKVEFCKQYGLDINKQDWDAVGFPQKVLADRGEMVGPIAENCIQNLRLIIENTASYMGCQKGIIEQDFNRINEEIKHWLPGAVNKSFGCRGEYDVRKSASLDIKEFTRIVIDAIIKRNNTWLDKYPRDEEMIKDGIKPIPAEIWRWALENKSGGLRKIPKDILILNLLREGKAAIKREGIIFKKLIYTSDILKERGYFLRAQTRGTIYVKVRFTLRDISRIYLILDNNEFVEATLNENKKFNHAFEGKMIEEIEDYFKEDVIDKNNEMNNQNNINLRMNEDIEKVIMEAKRKKGEEKNNIKHIKENRKIETVLDGLDNSLIKENPIKPKEENYNDKSVNDTVEKNEDTYTYESIMLQKIKNLKSGR